MPATSAWVKGRMPSTIILFPRIILFNTTSLHNFRFVSPPTQTQQFLSDGHLSANKVSACASLFICENWSQLDINKTPQLLLALTFSTLCFVLPSFPPMAGDNPKSSGTAQTIFKKLKAGRTYVLKLIYELVHLITTTSSNRRLKPYLMKARWIAQSIKPFLNIRRVFYAGIPEGLLDLSDEDGDEQE
jgi:hypothetical protein